MNSDSLFGSCLKEERKRLGLDQSQAAVLAGVSREMWGKYERDQGEPGVFVLSRLVLQGLDANYVLGGVRGFAPMSMSKRARALATAYDAMNESGRRTIDGVVALASSGQLAAGLGHQVFHGAVGQVVKDAAQGGDFTMNVGTDPKES